MKWLAWVLAVALCAPAALAQEDEGRTPIDPSAEEPEDLPPPPEDDDRRVVTPAEEPPPAAEPAPEDDGESRVVGTRKPRIPSETAPTPQPRKPKVEVRRTPDGKVIVPPKPRPLMDPIRPRKSKATGVQRAVTTTNQVLLGSLAGLGLVGCSAVSMVPILFVGTACLTPFASAPFAFCASGLCFTSLAVPHTFLTTLALFLPTVNMERDLRAALIAGAGVFLVDSVAILAGGVIATAILLRWARAPTNNATLPLLPSDFQPPAFRGADVAMVLNLGAVAATVAFIAPLVGAVFYTAANYLAGSSEEARIRRLAERRAARERRKAEKAKAQQKAKPDGGAQ